MYIFFILFILLYITLNYGPIWASCKIRDQVFVKLIYDYSKLAIFKNVLLPVFLKFLVFHHINLNHIVH